MDLSQITELSAQDMSDVNAKILEQLHSEVDLIQKLGYYIINSGGKRIRPMIAVLAARALNYHGGDHITLATFIEFIHTSTLLHDDVVDKSELRRGKATANAIFGNAASVLVGDFIYSRSFQLMASLNSLPILQLMSSATNVIAEGEVMQLMNCNDPDLDEHSYLTVIYSKTARLFEAAAQAAAMIAGATPEQEKALQEYGRYIGTAFQLIDDLLDYSSVNTELGKEVGHDLSEGKVTLPLLHAMQHCSDLDVVSKLRSAIQEGGGPDLLNDALHIMQQTQSLEYTQKRAEKEAEKAVTALSVLPDTPYKKALCSLASLSVARRF